MLYRHVNLVEFLDTIKNEKRVVLVENKVVEEYNKVVRIISGDFKVGNIKTCDYFNSREDIEPYEHKVEEMDHAEVVRFSDDSIDGSVEDLEMPEGVNEFFGVAEVVELTNKIFEDGTNQEYIATEVLVCVDISC